MSSDRSDRSDGDAEHGSDEVADRIDRLSRRARLDRRRVDDGIDDIPDRSRAMTYLRRGAGPAIALYTEGRTGGRLYEFTPDQYDRLERAMNDWFECYARCYGVDLDATFTVRKAAELLLETDDIADTAALLTGVPSRTGSTDESRREARSGTDCRTEGR